MRQGVKDSELEKLFEEYRTRDENNGCAHHWLIEEAQGHSSRGVCKRCGEEREFINSIPAYASLRPNAGVFDLPGIKDVAINDEEEN